MKKRRIIIVAVIVLIAISVFWTLFTYYEFSQGWISIDPSFNNPKIQIANTLSRCDLGTCNTTSFTLDQGTTISSSEFSTKGFDSHSILFDFDLKSLPAASAPEMFVAAINDNNSSSYFRYNGATKITASARVICETTGKELNNTLTQLGSTIELANKINPESLCRAEEYNPCCLVIIKRA